MHKNCPTDQLSLNLKIPFVLIYCQDNTNFEGDQLTIKKCIKGVFGLSVFEAVRLLEITQVL